jgi:hypothetical protein
MRVLTLSLVLLLFLLHCSPAPRAFLDANTPTGAVAYLLPLFFPKLKPSSAKEMKTYFIPRTGSSAIITCAKMSLTLPYSTDQSSLVAEFYHPGISSKVNGIDQISGQTKNNYSEPLTYVNIAANNTQKNYSLKSTTGSADSNTLLGFQFDSLNSRGLITGTNVSIFIPHGTDLSNLIPTFSHDGLKAFIGGVEQVSGKTASNFSSTVLFDIQSYNGSTKQYTITVNQSSVSSKDLKFFILNTSIGTIVGNNVYVSIPFGTDVTNLAASFAHTGKKILVNGITQINGETENNFTSPLKYTVVATDDSSQDYNVLISYGNTSFTGSSGIPPQSFTDNGNGTIKDNNTGLIWMKCTQGQV